MKNVVAIIQARMSSERLPGKVMLPLGGDPMLARVYDRLTLSDSFFDIAVATTKKPADDLITWWCVENNVPFTRGSEWDVLERYCEAARAHKADVIVRITADCPFIDATIIDEMLDNFLSVGANYLSNTLGQREYPRGLDVEIFDIQTLEIAHRDARAYYMREHVTPYIYENPTRFSLGSYRHSPDFSQYRLTVDTAEDYLLAKHLYLEFLWDTNWITIIEYLEKHPEWISINAHVKQKDYRV